MCKSDPDDKLLHPALLAVLKELGPLIRSDTSTLMLPTGNIDVDVLRAWSDAGCPRFTPEALELINGAQHVMDEMCQDCDATDDTDRESSGCNRDNCDASDLRWAWIKVYKGG